MKPIKSFLNIFIPLYLLLAFSTFIDQYLTSKLELDLRSPHGASEMIWFYGGLTLFNSIFFPVICCCLCLWSLKKHHIAPSRFADFLSKHMNHFFIEQLRGWGKTLQWSLLFFLPGLIKFVHYMMIPFVVILSPSYERGEVDALEASTAMVKKNFWKIIGWFTLFSFVLPLLLTTLSDSTKSFAQTPLLAFLWIIPDTCLLFLLNYLLFKIYIKTEGANKNESYV